MTKMAILAILKHFDQMFDKLVKIVYIEKRWETMHIKNTRVFLIYWFIFFGKIDSFSKIGSFFLSNFIQIILILAKVLNLPHIFLSHIFFLLISFRGILFPDRIFF